MLLYEHPLSFCAQKVRSRCARRAWRSTLRGPTVPAPDAPTGRSPPSRAWTGWHRRVRERPSVAATFAEFDAAAAELYTTGGRRREYRDHRLEWMVKAGGIEVVLAGLRDGNIRFPWPNAP